MTPAPDANALLQFFLIVALIAGTFSSVMLVARGFTRQKREVSFQQEFVSRDIFEATHSALSGRLLHCEAEIHAMREEWRQDRNEILAAGEQRAGKIHERINLLGAQITERIGELRGEIKRM